MACVGSGRKQVCWWVVMAACYSDFLSHILNELLPYNPTLQISPGILGCLPSVAPHVVFNLPPSVTLFIPIKQRRATVSLQCSCCGFRMTGSEDTARTVIGIIGNVISFFLFLSPCPTFTRIVRKKSTEEFEADPYLATVLNCSLWVFYGLPIVHPHSILVATINGTGLVMELAYLTIFFIYTTKGRRLKMVIFLCIEASAMASVVVVTMLGLHSHASRSNLVGAFCVVLNVMMHGSPLTITKKVITTKSVEFMPFYLSLTNFLNGLTWLIFALIRFDLYVAVGNGLGAIFGALQLILYAIYFQRTPESDTHIMYTSQWRSHQEDGCSSPPPFGRPSSPLLPPTP